MTGLKFMKQNKISVWDGEPWQTICIVHQSFTAKNSNETQALCEHRHTNPQSLSRKTNHSCVNPLHNFKVLKEKKKPSKGIFNWFTVKKKYIFPLFLCFLNDFHYVPHFIQRLKMHINTSIKQHLSPFIKQTWIMLKGWENWNCWAWKKESFWVT